MKRVIVLDQTYAPTFLQWMKERIGVGGDFKSEDCRTIAHVQFNDDGTHEILCVVALNRWTPTTCEGNIASDGTKRWFSRDFAFTVYDYVFRHADRTRMNFIVAEDNGAAIKMHQSLGHQYEAKLEDAFGEDKHALLFGLTRKQWVEGKWSSPAAINKRT